MAMSSGNENWADATSWHAILRFIDDTYFEREMTEASLSCRGVVLERKFNIFYCDGS